MIAWAEKEGWYEIIIKDLTFVACNPVTEEMNFFAIKLSELFCEKRNEIYRFVVKNISDFYGKRGFSAQDIYEKLGEPQITIYSADSGELCWLDHKMDEHIIICEFINDFNLLSVLIDG